MSLFSIFADSCCFISTIFDIEYLSQEDFLVPTDFNVVMTFTSFSLSMLKLKTDSLDGRSVWMGSFPHRDGNPLCRNILNFLAYEEIHCQTDKNNNAQYL